MIPIGSRIRKKTNSRNTFKFKPFSKRQLKILTFWQDNSPYNDIDVVIADGAIRSGKTVCMALSFVMFVMARFNYMHAGMCGKSIGTFRRNVLYPLKQMLLVLGYDVIEHRTDNFIEVYKNGVSNNFYMFGGKDERSQDFLQGITLCSIFFDEVALMPQSFVNQGTARCSVDGSKIFFNCNPASPYHWFYIEWILKSRQKNSLYLHFTMDDNLSLSQSIKDRYKRNYSGVFYKRYIEGEWCQAEGLVYDMFDEARNVIRHSDIPYEDIIQWWVCSDYGTGNATTFLIQGRTIDFTYYTIGEYFYDGHTHEQKTDLEYSNDLIDFIEKYKPYTNLGYADIRVFVDPSAASFKTQLRRHRMKVINANNDVIDGIRYVGTKLKAGESYVSDKCVNTIREFYSYVWDEKAQLRGEDKPKPENDHCLDAYRYGHYTNREGLKLKRMGYQTGKV